MKLRLNDLTLIIQFENKNEEKLIKKFITFKDDKNAFFGGRFHPERIKDVCLGKDIKGYFVCFAGFTKEIIIFAKQNNLAITQFEDLRTHFDFQKKEWTHDELKKFFGKHDYEEHQIRALQAMVKTNTGIIKAPTSAGKCVSGNTKITINGKKVKIKSLFKNFEEEEFKKPEKELKVLTEKGERKIELLYKTNKRNVIKIKLNNKNILIGVPEHRVMTNNGWKFLKDLEKGDLILCQKKVNWILKFLMWIYQKL